jgi:hypothetical protein
MTQPMVLVTWADAHSGVATWTPIESLDKDEMIVATCGFLLATCDGGKPDHVTVYQSRTMEDDIDHVLHIPCAMVRHIAICTPDQLG